MITSIEINNFRCFKQTKAKGFGQVNLFGGRNNAGKTALLEALLLMGEPSNQSIVQLLKQRKVDTDLIKAMPQNAWDNFFYQQNKETAITLSLNADQEHTIMLTCDESVDDFIELVKKDDSDEDLVSFANDLSSKDSLKSALHISTIINEASHQNVFVASKKGIIGRGAIRTHKNTSFIYANMVFPNRELASGYDQTKLLEISNVLLDAFKIIDPTIVSVDSFSIGSPDLRLKRENEKYMTLAMFGDAMNKIAGFTLNIVNNKNGVLLIDEIENGIHHENQEEIWSFLISLCKEYNVQLFATSHSLEMIDAYNRVVLANNYTKDCFYFEMMRHIKTNDVIIEKLSIDVLVDKMKNNDPIRGELINNRK